MKKLSVLIALISLISCKPTQDVSSSTNKILPDGDYKVTKLNGEYVKEAKIRITFNKTTNGITANAGCNNMSGSYTKQGESLFISEMMATKMYCEGPAMIWERSLTEALKQTGSFEFENDVITLYSKEDKKTLIIAVRQY